jgi:hypothetical protein
VRGWNGFENQSCNIAQQRPLAGCPSVTQAAAREPSCRHGYGIESEAMNGKEKTGLRLLSIRCLDGQDGEAAKRVSLLIAVRIFAAVTSVALALYWALFAMDSFPWIVPADHNSDYLKAYGNAAMAGLIMSVVSVASIIIATGALARTSLGWGLSAFLIGCIIVASMGLYPQLESMHFLPCRFAAQLAGVVIILLGIAGPALPAKQGNENGNLWRRECKPSAGHKDGGA